VIVRNPRNPRPGEPSAQRFGEFADRLHGDHWQPDVDVFETEEAVIVRAELAGVRRGDLRVTVDGDMLRIRGLREGSGAAAVPSPNGDRHGPVRALPAPPTRRSRSRDGALGC
jgi:HSP20 family molecular chaperone IbpA